MTNISLTTEAAAGGVSVKKVVVKTLSNFKESTCVGSLFSINLIFFIKTRLQHRCFPVKCAKFSRTTILNNICQRLLLHHLPLGNVFVGGLKLTFPFFSYHPPNYLTLIRLGGVVVVKRLPPAPLPPSLPPFGTFCFIDFL